MLEGGSQLTGDGAEVKFGDVLPVTDRHTAVGSMLTDVSLLPGGWISASESGAHMAWRLPGRAASLIEAVDK